MLLDLVYFAVDYNMVLLFKRTTLQLLRNSTIICHCWQCFI